MRHSTLFFNTSLSLSLSVSFSLSLFLPPLSGARPRGLPCQYSRLSPSSRAGFSFVGLQSIRASVIGLPRVIHFRNLGDGLMWRLWQAALPLPRPPSLSFFLSFSPSLFLSCALLHCSVTQWACAGLRKQPAYCYWLAGQLRGTSLLSLLQITLVRAPSLPLPILSLSLSLSSSLFTERLSYFIKSFTFFLLYFSHEKYLLWEIRHKHNNWIIHGSTRSPIHVSK